MLTFKLKKSVIAFISALAALPCLINLWSFYGKIARNEILGWQDALYIVGCCIILYSWLTIPAEIRVLSENRIEFNAPIKRTEVAVSDIKFIKPQALALNSAFLRVRHTRGRITVIDDFYTECDFVTTLKSFNSEIDVKGRAWL